jgi:intracellular septation protein
MSNTAPAKTSPKTHPGLRMAVDYAAPATSLIAYMLTKDVLVTTWWLVGVSALAILISVALERRLAPLPIIFGVSALIFGGLTLVFHDKVFIQIKPSILDVTFGAALLVGLAIGKSPIRLIVGDGMKLSDAGWRTLTLRFGLFFLALAALNLAIMFFCSFQIWLYFRFPGALIVTLLFAFSQVPLMVREASAMEAAANLADSQP